jgi:hypothetical protein
MMPIIVTMALGLFLGWVCSRVLWYGSREWKKAKQEINQWKDQERKLYLLRVEDWHNDLVRREKAIEHFKDRMRKQQATIKRDDARLDFMERFSMEEPLEFEPDGTPILP